MGVVSAGAGFFLAGLDGLDAAFVAVGRGLLDLVVCFDGALCAGAL